MRLTFRWGDRTTIQSHDLDGDGAVLIIRPDTTTDERVDVFVDTVAQADALIAAAVAARDIIARQASLRCEARALRVGMRIYLPGDPFAQTIVALTPHGRSVTVRTHTGTRTLPGDERVRLHPASLAAV